MNKFLALLLTLVFLSTSVIAEPKRLICSYTDMKGLESTNSLFPGDDKISYSGLPIGMSLNRYEKDCPKNPQGSYEVTVCERLEKLRAFIKTDTCKELGYLARNTFTFDTDDLNTTAESNAEFYSDNCGENFSNGWSARVSSSDIKQVTMTATPSFIRFRGAHSNKVMFNVDRKTLKSGYISDRSWECKLEDVDTSDNLL